MAWSMPRLPLSKSARNERIKLTATFLNGIGVACVAVGGLAPLIALGNGTVHPGPVIYGLMAACVAAAVCLHLVARSVLLALAD